MTVLPAYFYRDPAEVVERGELDALGCHACKSLHDTFELVVCGEERNKKQKGVPFIGHRCRWFDERG